MNIVRSIRGLALVGLAALGFASTANAQNAVDVDITFAGGGIAILNYYSDIDVSINTAQLASIAAPSCTVTAGVANCDDGASGSLATALNAGVLEADGLMDLAGENEMDSVNLDLDNVWAVRAIGGSTANTTVAVTIGAGTTLANGAAEIEVNTVEVYSDTNPAPAASTTFPDPGLAASNAEFGGVRLNLDLSNATATAGTYSAAAATYTIAVTGT